MSRLSHWVPRCCHACDTTAVPDLESKINSVKAAPHITLSLHLIEEYRPSTIRLLRGMAKTLHLLAVLNADFPPSGHESDATPLKLT